MEVGLQPAPCQSPLVLLLATIKALTVRLGRRGPWAPLTLVLFQTMLKHSVNILPSLKCFQNPLLLLPRRLCTFPSHPDLSCLVFTLNSRHINYSSNMTVSLYNHVNLLEHLRENAFADIGTMRLMADHISELNDYSWICAPTLIPLCLCSSYVCLAGCANERNQRIATMTVPINHGGH